MGKDNLVFLKQCITDFQTTGAIFRSSRKAALALTEPLRSHRAPLRILELGPGTGAITAKILEDMVPGDELDICEINANFMRALREKLKLNPNFQKHREKVVFHLCPAQDLPENKTYDVIVCCLPFLNFDIGTVEDIFNKLRVLSSELTVMTYFEYTGFRTVGRMVSPRLRAINDFMNEMYQQHRVKHERVLLNLFPMNVHTLRLAA